MSLELITGALAAGAAAGVTTTASTAVTDAYRALKTTVIRWLPHRGDQVTELEAQQVGPQVWQAQLGPDLIVSGAVHDGELLAAAQAVLAAAGRPNIHHISVTTSTGVVGGMFTGPVTVTNNPPHPPAPAAG